MDKNSAINLLKKYENWNKENTPKIHLNGEKHIAKCIHTYDGDTCWLALFLNHADETPFQFKVRMLGYDSPEIRTKDQEEKKMWTRVEFSDEEDKWGRCLAKIYVATSSASSKETNSIPLTCHAIDDTNQLKENLLCVNDYMMEHARSYSYDGGKKKKFGKDY